MTETIFEEKKIYKNKFVECSKQSATIIETIKSEAELLLALKSFSSNNNKNILVLKFGENDLDKINSINHVINTSAQENKKLLNKNILFIVHKKREYFLFDSIKKARCTYKKSDIWTNPHCSANPISLVWDHKHSGTYNRFCPL